MEPIYVYRMDCEIKDEIPLGILWERREEERGDNSIGMLMRARREFAETPNGGQNIFISYYPYDD